MHYKCKNTISSNPLMNQFANRSLLLDGISIEKSLITRDEGLPKIDITHIVRHLVTIGSLKNGERPLIILANNALMFTNDPNLQETLKEIIEKLENHYEGVLIQYIINDFPDEIKKKVMNS